MKLLFSWLVAQTLLISSVTAHAQDHMTRDLVSNALTKSLGHPLSTHESVIAHQVADLISARSVVTPITQQESLNGLTYIFDPQVLEHFQTIASSKTPINELHKLLPRKGTLE